LNFFLVFLSHLSRTEQRDWDDIIILTGSNIFHPVRITQVPGYSFLKTGFEGESLFPAKGFLKFIAVYGIAPVVDVLSIAVKGKKVSRKARKGRQGGRGVNYNYVHTAVFFY
jgi:hypothetical protein